MSSKSEVVDYLEIASSLSNISEDLQQTVKITCDPINLVDFTTFHDRLKREINEIERTPTKEGPSIGELRNFFDEELPLKLQRVNKRVQHKELHRLNLTIVPNKKDSSASSNLSSTILANATAPVAPSSTSFGMQCASSSNSLSKLCITEELRTPRKIYNDYINVMTKLNELVKEKLDNLKFTKNNIALKNTKKIIKDLEKLSDLLKEENTREAFTVKQEENIKIIGNIISQYVFVQENKDLFKVEIQNYESLDILMNVVNDLLHEITLIS